MGNFLQAQLADSNGVPLEGRITAYSDVDSISTELDAGGLLVLPSRHRSWIALQTPQGAKFLLHAPSAFGRLGTFRLGSARPRSWAGLKRIATIRIAGRGKHPVHRRPVPIRRCPPRPDATRSVLRLLQRIDRIVDRLRHHDSRRGHGGLVHHAAAFRLQAASSSSPPATTRPPAAATCPQWLWTHANVIGNTPTASPRHVPADLPGLADSSRTRAPSSPSIPS